MLSFQIREEIQRILQAFEDADYFFECLDQISGVFPPVNGSLQDIAGGGDKARHAPDQLRTHLAQTRKKLTDVKPRKFFAATEKLQAELRNAQKLGFHDSSQLHVIEHMVEAFSRKYEVYIDGYAPASAASMVVEARSLHSTLNGFKHGLNFYLANIENEVGEMEDGRELSVLLRSTLTLEEFSRKLGALVGLYAEICMLMGVSISDSPVQIIKIESGSLWAKLFGNSKVMAILGSVIESGAEFVYRNYTDEGKLVAIPKKVEAVDSILGLRARLGEHGIDTAELDEYIKKSSVSIAKDINTLISGQAEVVVNDNRISIGGELQKKLIETKAPLKLGFDDDPEQSSN